MASGRHERIHLQNVRISVGARRHHFDERIGVPFLCECDDDECHEFVIVRLREFEHLTKSHLILVAPNHVVALGMRSDSRDGYDLYRPTGEHQAAG